MPISKLRLVKKLEKLCGGESFNIDSTTQGMFLRNIVFNFLAPVTIAHALDSIGQKRKWRKV
jgi:hypothetical protein